MIGSQKSLLGYARQSLRLQSSYLVCSRSSSPEVRLKTRNAVFTQAKPKYLNRGSHRGGGGVGWGGRGVGEGGREVIGILLLENEKVGRGDSLT